MTRPRTIPFYLAAAALLTAAAPTPDSPARLEWSDLNRRPDGNARLSALGTDAQGRPVLAWTESGAAGSGQGTYALRLEAGRWSLLGGEQPGGNLNEDARHNAAQLTLAVGQDGAPALGWAEDSGTAHVDSYLTSRYDGASWSPPGAYAVRRNLSDAGRSRAFVPGPGGLPLIAWTNIYFPGAEGSVVQLLSWNGKGFDSSEPLNRSLKRTAFFPSIGQRRGGVDDGDGAAGEGTLVAWLEGNVAASNVYVSLRQGKRWQALGGALNVRPNTYTFAPQLRLNVQGNPLVVWQEDWRGADNLYLKRWTGTSWEALGGSLNHDPRRLAERPALALDAAGDPVVAWSEERGGDQHAVYARRWKNGRWTLLGQAAVRRGALSGDGDALSASVTVAGNGQVLVSWCERVGQTYHLRVRTFGAS